MEMKARDGARASIDDHRDPKPPHRKAEPVVDDDEVELMRIDFINRPGQFGRRKLAIRPIQMFGDP